MHARTITPLLALALAACAATPDYATISKEQFRNDAGTVVGHRELLQNKQTGEYVNKVELYAALTDASGKVIGYEQRTRSGGIVYDSEGRPIGARMIDLRSRGTNPQGSGVVFMY
jgi:hypothetical protein